MERMEWLITVMHMKNKYGSGVLVGVILEFSHGHPGRHGHPGTPLGE